MQTYQTGSSLETVLNLSTWGNLWHQLTNQFCALNSPWWCKGPFKVPKVMTKSEAEVAILRNACLKKTSRIHPFKDNEMYISSRFNELHLSNRPILTEIIQNILIHIFIFIHQPEADIYIYYKIFISSNHLKYALIVSFSTTHIGTKIHLKQKSNHLIKYCTWDWWCGINRIIIFHQERL